MRKYFIASLATLALSTFITLTASAGSIFQMRLVEDHPSDGTEQMTVVTTNNQQVLTHVYYVDKAVLLDQTALKSAKAGTDKRGYAKIDVTFTEAGAKSFADITRENLNKQLAIIVDGQVREAPRIASEISGGKAVITGSFSKQEAKDLAKKLNEAAKKK